MVKEKINSFNCNKQIKRLYISSMIGQLSITGAWVAILADRGFNLVEIGIAETVFHIVSFIFEIPSGVLADVFGRKKTLIISTIMNMLGCTVMIASTNLLLVCTAIGLFALSDNFASGSGDALAYDSLKLENRQREYEKYESNQLIIYRLCEGISTMCAGLALLIGYKIAYATSLATDMIQIIILYSLIEVGENENRKNEQFFCSIKCELAKCMTESIAFLKKAKKAILLMFCNSLVGAVDILLLFYLQAKLLQTGMHDMWLGIALFVMQLGGVLGAKITLKFGKICYWKCFAASTIIVILGVVLEHSGLALVMTIGGCIAAFGDDALQVRTNTKLQDMFPSEQRATLISFESFTFSVIMIALSPLVGWFFSMW